MRRDFHVPVKGDVVLEAVLDVPVQQIVADIRRGALHPLDVDGALANVKVVLQELVPVRWRLPVELFGNVRPEGGRIVDALLVHLAVLLQPRTVGLALSLRVRQEDALLLGRHGLGHFHAIVTCI